MPPIGKVHENDLDLLGQYRDIPTHRAHSQSRQTARESLLKLSLPAACTATNTNAFHLQHAKNRNIKEQPPRLLPLHAASTARCGRRYGKELLLHLKVSLNTITSPPYEPHDYRYLTKPIASAFSRKQRRQRSRPYLRIIPRRELQTRLRGKRRRGSGEPFIQALAGRRRARPGTGLGVCAARRRTSHRRHGRGAAP